MLRNHWERARAVIACAIVICAGLTCTDATSPAGARVALGIAPVFSQAAAETYVNLVSVGLVVDNIHLELEHADGTTAIDTTVAVAADQDSVVIELVVTLHGNAEELKANIDLKDGDIVLFSGTQNILAVAGGITQSPPQIPVEYSGPGSSLVAVELGPADTTIRNADSVVYRPSAKDKDSSAVTDFAILWSLKDSTVGSISSAGVFKPSVARGQTWVYAKTPNNIKDSARVGITPPASALVLVSGGGQTGIVGQPLALPVVVEVQATDNLPAPGIVVAFSTSGGDAFAAANAVADANGRVSGTLTLGTLPGTHTLQATSTGLTALPVNETANPDKASKLAITQQPSATATAGIILATQPKVQIQDQYGNVVAAAGIPIVAALAVPAGRTLGGTLSVASDANGLVTYSGLLVLGAAGSVALTFSQDTLGSVTSNNIALADAPGPDHLRFVAAAGGTGGTLLAPITVELLDQNNNRLETGAGSTASVTLAIKSGTGTVGAVLGPNAGALTQAAVAGVATFLVSIDKVGTGYVLLASSPETPTGGVECTPINIALGPPALLTVVSGDSLGVLKTGEVVPTLRVSDAGSNDVAGATVGFAITSGGGELSTASTVTNATGLANVDWHVGTAGAQAMTATVGGLSLVFHAFLAETLVIVTAPEVTPHNGIALTPQPKIQLRDKTGRQIKLAGVQVAVNTCCRNDLVDAVSAALSGTTSVFTDANGEAQFSDLTLSGTFGVTTKLAFGAATIDSAYSALLTLTGGYPQQIVNFDGDYLRSATAGTQLLRARVYDGDLNPVIGQEVKFTVYEGPCSFEGSSTFTTTTVSANGGFAEATAAITGSLTSCMIQALVVLPPPDCPGGCEVLPPPTRYLRMYVAPAGLDIWTGATDDNYGTRSNWYSGNAPSTATSLFVPMSTGPNNGSTTYPTLYAMQGAKTLLIESEGHLFMNGQDFEVVDTLFADGSVEDGGILVVTGAGAQLRGTVRGLVHIGYSECTSTNGMVIGAFSVDSIEVNCGLYVLENFPVDVSGQMRVKTGATFYQNKGTVTVADSAFFLGQELLTGGILDLQGAAEIYADGEGSQFNASSPHVTRLTRTSGDTLRLKSSVNTVYFGVLEIVATNTAGAALNYNGTTGAIQIEVDTLRIKKDSRLGLGALTITTIGTYLDVEENAHLLLYATLFVGPCVPSVDFGLDNVGAFHCSGYLPMVRAGPPGKKAIKH